MRHLFLCFFLLILAACATVTPKPAPEKITLMPVSFGELDGWRQDAAQDALNALRRSCVPLAGKNADWRAACAAAQNVASGNDAARDYFEQWFRPYAAGGNDGDTGLFTGYYAPEVQGSRQRGGVFQTPLYARPDDMISVDLGAFKHELQGQHIVGKVDGRKLIPYDDRAAIAAGSLADRAQPLVWVDDPIAAFFLEVQGSGRVRLAEGGVMTVGYDGANGRAYVAIGRVMAARGDIGKPVTMPAIKAWLAAHPDRAQQVMNENPSYVFFRILPGDDVVGGEGVALTPQRSLAVDPDFVPLGAPVWLDTTDGQGAPFRHLMVAQDTGGAIKGPVRGDIFWGAGDMAAAQAGAMQSRGKYYLLLPKTVDADGE